MYTSTTQSPDGWPLISYVDAASRSLKVTKCIDILCSSSFTTHATVDGAGDVSSQQTSITIGVDGLPLISYTGNADLRVAHCGNLKCTTAATATLDAAVQDSSIALGSDGLGIVSYFNSTSGSLKVAHCVNRVCQP